MDKTGRNNPCTCGSGKKYKKCCLDKKPREHTIIVASTEPLHGFDYDKKRMEFTGLTHDDQLIKPVITYSQTHYMSDSGKEKVLARIQDKVIPNEAELMRHLSSDLDLIIAIDTNIRVIRSERISVSGVIHCVLQRTANTNNYHADFPWHGAVLFRNCPSDLPSEKFGWMIMIQRINREPLNKLKRFAIVTDHDLDNHTSYNAKKAPICKDFYLPDNFTLMYGRGDGPNQSLLNYLVKQCDKESKEVLRIIEQTGYYQHGDKKYSIDQIPVPSL
jgi:SEC-C motif